MTSGADLPILAWLDSPTHARRFGGLRLVAFLTIKPGTRIWITICTNGVLLPK